MVKGNEVENGTRRRAMGSKIEGNGQSQGRSKNGNNKKNNNSKTSTKSKKIEGNGNYIDEEPEVLVAPDSENNDVDEEEDIAVRDDEEEEEEGANGAENGSAKGKAEATKKINKRKKNGKKRKNSEGEGDGDDSSSSTCFPMNRISRIIKSEDADIRITQESVFLVNKATEKFLELFCKEAHACAVLDSKNQVWYKHLSSVVSKRKRFDFLLDIVPEKVKAKDALAEMSIAET